MPNSRTATITAGFSASEYKPLLTLLGSSLASKTRRYRDVKLENKGDTDLYIASMQAGSSPATPTAGDRKTIEAGDAEFLGEIETDQLFVLTANESGNNQLEFVGEPQN